MKTRVALLFLFAYATFAFAQSDTGRPSDEGMLAINAYESVNLGNLNIHISAPLRSKAGPVPLSAGLALNAQLVPEGNCIRPGCFFFSTAMSGGTLPPYGLRVLQGYWAGGLSAVRTGSATCGGLPDTQYILTAVVDNSGTVHSLPANTLWDSTGCLYAPLDVVTTDGSQLELVTYANSLNATVYADGIGTTVQWSNGIPPTTVTGTTTDMHGNTLTISQNGSTFNFVDQLTATPALSFVAGGPYNYTDRTGTQRSVRVAYDNTLHMLPTYNLTGCSFIGNADQGIMHAPLSIAYPDSSVVNFTWEKTAAGNYDGRLATVKIPTGATYTHTYSGGTNGEGINCDTANLAISNATMTISNGSGTWTFARTVGSGTYPNRTITTTVTKPDGAKNVYTFIGDQSPIITSAVMKDTDGTTVLSTVAYCYDSIQASCNSTLPTQHPTWVRIYNTVPGVASSSEVDTKFDTSGNVIETDSYGFGVTLPTLISKAIAVYGSWDTSSSSCVSLASIHITGKPCDVQVQDASGTMFSHSRFTYNTSNGNLLYQYDYSSATAFLTTAFLYNTNGTPAQITGADGFQATLAYNGTGGCNNLLPTSAITPFGTSSATWDCNGAVPLTTTDLNGLVVTHAYGDPLYRTTQLSDNGGQAPVNYTYTSPTQTRKSMAFNGTSSIVDTNTKLDAFGHVLSVQHRQSPTGSYDTTSYTYDTSGRVSGVSVPCSTATLGGTCVTLANTATYDGMGRPKTQTIKTGTNGVVTYTYSNGDVKTVITPAPTGEVAKTTQTEYDGLGRVVSSCVVTSTLSGNGSCGQRTAANGYLTKSTLDALGRPTQVSRNAQTGATPLNSTATYDFLSRTTQQVAPETGTSSFVYDTQLAACTTVFATNLPGHLSQSTDGAGNVMCYHYDGPSGLATAALLGVFGVSGPNLANTANRNFAYGVSGQGGTTNSVGRLYQTATTTSPGCGGSNSQTAVFYSYDLYGRLNQVQQTSCGLSNSTQYFTTNATYWDNGQIKTLGGIPGVSGFSFGIDGEGRANSATSGANSIVSSVVYDPASNPLTVNYANGDQDSYTYDGASQNMTQYKFKLGAAGTTDTGTLIWNPNLTVQSLAIVDNINAGDTQTCTTSHDDIARITGWNCGALWNETYAYSHDYAGNVTKSGSLSFAPGYTASNNRMLSPYTYDANGQLLHDGTLGLNYVWGANGEMTSYGTGVTLINDSLGNMLEKKVGSTHTYSLYSPIGNLGTTSSVTAKLSLRIPLPGGGSIIYDSAGNEQLNHPDYAGSTRLVTNRVARTYAAQFCYGPMGEIYCGTASASQYEGTFQDTTTGLDDFDASRYSSAQGRTISPTGGANPYVKTNRPF